MLQRAQTGASGGGGNAPEIYVCGGNLSKSQIISGGKLHINTGTNTTFISTYLSDVTSCDDVTYEGAARTRIIFSKDKYYTGLASNYVSGVTHLTAGSPLYIFREGSGAGYNQAFALYDSEPTT